MYSEQEMLIARLGASPESSFDPYILLLIPLVIASIALVIILERWIIFEIKLKLEDWHDEQHEK